MCLGAGAGTGSAWKQRESDDVSPACKYHGRQRSEQCLQFIHQVSDLAPVPGLASVCVYRDVCPKIRREKGGRVNNKSGIEFYFVR